MHPKEAIHSCIITIVFLESGEWPTAAISKRLSGLGLSGTLDTPVCTPDPSRVGTPSASEYSCAMDDDEVRIEASVAVLCLFKLSI